MVTSKKLPGGAVIVKSGRRGIGGPSLVLMLIILVLGLLGLAGVGLFAPTRLALAQEQALSLLHGGIARVDEQTYVDACVAVEGADGSRAVTRTHRTIAFNDGTTLAVVFSGQPAATNACP